MRKKRGQGSIVDSFEYCGRLVTVTKSDIETMDDHKADVARDEIVDLGNGRTLTVKSSDIARRPRCP